MKSSKSNKVLAHTESDAKISDDKNLAFFSAVDRMTVSEIVHKSRSHHGNEGTVDGVLSDIIEEILWLESGHHENIKLECSTSTENIKKTNANNYYDTDHIDKRLLYWQNYIKSQEDMKKKIKKYTSKNDDEILINRQMETDRMNLMKRIMTYAERMNPTNLQLHRESVEARLICNRPDVYDTVPQLERTQKYTMELIDRPNICLAEQGIKKFQPEIKSKWMSSNYLSNKVQKTQHDIQNLIEYYPDFNELQIVGKKKPLLNFYDEQNQLNHYKKLKLQALPSVLPMQLIPKTDPNFLITITDAYSLHAKECDRNYHIDVNDINLDLAHKESNSVYFDYVFENSKPYEKSKQLLVKIINYGLKSVKFQWHKLEKNEGAKLSMLINRLENHVPAFYFDKNPFRLNGGQRKELQLYYNCSRFSINTETWILETVPKFFKNNTNLNIYFHMFGSCVPCNKTGQNFINLRDSLILKGNQAMAKTLINSVIYPAMMPTTPLPYVQCFTDEEIFNSLYPKINFSESFLDEMKQLYKEIYELYPNSKLCTKWSFDIYQLRDMIIKIDDDIKRKEFFDRFTNMINDVRNTPHKYSLIYRENQKFILVRSVIISAMDRIDIIASDITTTLMETNLNLDFNEVLITNKFTKPSKMIFPSSVSTGASQQHHLASDGDKKHENSQLGSPETTHRRTWHGDRKHSNTHAISSRMYHLQQGDIPPSFCVVKSEIVQQKRNTVLSDSLYFQVAVQLGQMAEEIVSVLEGVKHIF